MRCFRLSVSSVRDETQIHTHMCYSEFSDIMRQIQEMDADVLLIETARSKMELLEDWKRTGYQNEIGPGVYDIHSPRIPSTEEMAELLRLAAQVLAPEQLWVNPDCGLKTRGYEEVEPSLKNMVAAAKQLRGGLLPPRGTGRPVRGPVEIVPGVDGVGEERVSWGRGRGGRPPDRGGRGHSRICEEARGGPRAIGRAPSDVAALVLTHSDADHTGIAPRLRDAGARC